MLRTKQRTCLATAHSSDSRKQSYKTFFIGNWVIILSATIANMKIAELQALWDIHKNDNVLDVVLPEIPAQPHQQSTMQSLAMSGGDNSRKPSMQAKTIMTNSCNNSPQ